jgi:hypothetical protein
LLPTVYESQARTIFDIASKFATPIDARSDKTEQATPKQLLKARKEGNFPSTRQFLAGIQFVVFVGSSRTWVAAGWTNFGLSPPRCCIAHLDPI